MPPEEPFPHGTTYGYRLGDRCDACREAKRLDWQAYKQRTAANALEDFEGHPEGPDQVAAILEQLVLRVRCDCGLWHEEEGPGFQCPSGAMPPDFPDPEVQ